jgi:hypothetical protein
MSDIGKIINILLANPDLASRIVLRPAVFGDAGDGRQQTQNRLRSEEALRWLVLADEFPKKYMAYLKLYAEDPASSYWIRWLKKIGLSQKKFMRRIEANQSRIGAYKEDFAQISSGEPVMIMVNNRAKAPVANEKELVRALKSIHY